LEIATDDVASIGFNDAATVGTDVESSPACNRLRFVPLLIARVKTTTDGRVLADTDPRVSITFWVDYPFVRFHTNVIVPRDPQGLSSLKSRINVHKNAVFHHATGTRTGGNHCWSPTES
jgi:hypothetical protein